MSKYTLNSLINNDINSWSSVPRDPAFVGSMLFAPGQFTVLTAKQMLISKIIFYGGATLVASYALKYLLGAKKRDDGRELLANIKDPAAPHDIVYGEVRKGGVITHLESTDNNQYLHMFVVLAGHEIESVQKIYINDEDHTDNWTRGTGLVNGTTNTEVDWKNKLRIFAHLGDQTLASDTFESSTSTLASTYHTESENSDVDQYFVGKGLSYLYIRMNYDKDVFSDGIPEITAVIRGKKVENESGVAQTYPASSNAAYVIRDYILSDYGVGDSTDNIDTTTFASAATICNTNSGSGGDNKLFVNGVLSTSNSRIDNLETLTAACGGSLFWGSGKWKLKAAAFTSPVKTLDLSDLRGNIQIGTRHSRRDNFNTIQGTFNDKDQDWIEADYPEVTSSAYQTEDGGVKTTLDLSFPAVTNSIQAQRLAKLTLNRHREQISFSADFGLNAFDLEVGDVIKFNDYNSATNSYRYGFYSATPADQKTFEVIGWRFSPQGEDRELNVNLSLREISSTAFDWDADEQAIINNNTTLGRTVTNLDPSNVLIADTGYTATDGTFVPQLDVNWTAATNSFVLYYEVQWREVNETSYFNSTVNGTDILIGPVATGAEYEVRVRGVSNSGATSEWVSPATHTVGGDTLAPSPVTNLTATSGFQQVTLDWTAPTTNTDATTLYDLQGYYIYRATNQSQPATPIAFFNGDKYVDGGLEVNRTYFYWVEAVDFSGNTSTAVASSSVTTSDISLEGPQLVKTMYYDDRYFAGSGTSVNLNTGMTSPSIGGSYFLADIDGGTTFSFDTSTGILSSANNIVSNNSITYNNVLIFAIKSPDEDNNANNTSDVYEQLDRIAVGSEIALKNGTDITVFEVTELKGVFEDTNSEKIHCFAVSYKDGESGTVVNSGDGNDVNIILNYHLKGVSGAAYKKVRLFQNSSSGAPTVPATTAGFNTTDGSAVSTGNWAVSASTPAALETVYVAEMDIEQVESVGDWVSAGNWVANPASSIGATGANGTNGTDGSDAPRFAEITLYRLSATQPAAPSATITWSTGAISGITSNWSRTAPTQTATSTDLVWSSYLVFIDTTAPFSSTTATGSTPSSAINFSGLVTFTGGDFAVDGSTITSIDGGNITTGSIKADSIDIDQTLTLTGPTSGFVGGRSGTSDFGTDGFYVGRTSSSGNTADGFQLSHTSLTTANHPQLNTGTVQGVIHDDTQGLRIYEPIFYKRGSGAGSDTLLTTQSSTATLEAGKVHTIAMLGGGGGGGGGKSGDSNNSGSPANAGNAGGTTTVVLTGATGYNGTRTFNASGGAGGAAGVGSSNNSNNNGRLSGQDGHSSVYGDGGAGSDGGSYNSGHNFPGDDAPNTSYGAGGGGGSGWYSTNYRGAGGGGGLAAQLTTVTIDLTNANTNGTLTVNALGAGGNGGNYNNSNSTERANSGGAGAGGAVSISGVLDGYVPYTIDGVSGNPPWFNNPTGGTNTSANHGAYNTDATILTGGTNGRWFGGRLNTNYNFGSSVKVNGNGGFLFANSGDPYPAGNTITVSYADSSMFFFGKVSSNGNVTFTRQSSCFLQYWDI